MTVISNGTTIRISYFLPNIFRHFLPSRSTRWRRFNASRTHPVSRWAVSMKRTKQSISVPYFCHLNRFPFLERHYRCRHMWVIQPLPPFPCVVGGLVLHIVFSIFWRHVRGMMWVIDILRQMVDYLCLLDLLHIPCSTCQYYSGCLAPGRLIS